MKDKINNLEEELAKYQGKLEEMIRNWSATKGGSRYGDEYLETQIKVYQSMIAEVQTELQRLRRVK